MSCIEKCYAILLYHLKKSLYYLYHPILQYLPHRKILFLLKYYSLIFFYYFFLTNNFFQFYFPRLFNWFSFSSASLNLWHQLISQNHTHRPINPPPINPQPNHYPNTTQTPNPTTTHNPFKHRSQPEKKKKNHNHHSDPHIATHKPSNQSQQRPPHPPPIRTTPPIWNPAHLKLTGANPFKKYHPPTTDQPTTQPLPKHDPNPGPNHHPQPL